MGKMKLVTRLCAALTLRDRIARSRDRLYKVAFAWCGDEMVADDLVQEAMALALQKSHQLRDPDRLYAWMYSVLHNCWRQYLRRQRPSCQLDEEQMAGEPSVEGLTSRIEIVERVRAAVARLPVAQREVVTLVDLEGFAYAEVAEILEIPIGTVMSRLNRARKALQGSLRAIRPQPEDLADGDVPAEPARLRRVR